MSVLHFMCYFSLSNSFSESCFCTLFSSSKNAVPDSPLLSAFICTLSCSAFVWVTKVHNNHESGLLQTLSLTLSPFLLKKPTTFGWVYRSWTRGCPEHLLLIWRPFFSFLSPSWDNSDAEVHLNFCYYGDWRKNYYV